MSDLLLKRGAVSRIFEEDSERLLKEGYVLRCEIGQVGWRSLAKNRVERVEDDGGGLLGRLRHSAAILHRRELLVRLEAAYGRRVNECRVSSRARESTGPGGTGWYNRSLALEWCRGMLRFSTAGESHGEALVAQVSGLPAGVPVDQSFLDRELWRRQQGFGRGGRMRIEQDRAHILSGVRHGKTIGSPVAMTLANNDWKNWEEILPVAEGEAEKHKAVKSPRPGHADLAGSLKYDFPDARYVLERASARESAARVACGALAKMLLAEFGVGVGESHDTSRRRGTRARRGLG